MQLLKNLDNPKNFSLALSCLLATPDAVDILEKMEHSEPNLLLACCFLAERGNISDKNSVTSIVRNSKPNPDFTKYHRKLLSLVQGDSLIDFGVDSTQFTSDEAYRKGMILTIYDAVVQQLYSIQDCSVFHV